MSSLSLKAEHIAKAYKLGRLRTQRKYVLEDISFEVESGVTLGIMGESGTGKTTLGRVLAGIEKASGGAVFFGEQRIDALRKEDYARFRRNVQIVFQNPEGSLNPKKTVEKSLHQVLELIGISREERIEVLYNMLQTVGVSDDLLCRYPHQLSGGQNQKVALARVLLLKPDFIILDEPTSALDISVRAQILHLLKEWQAKNRTGFIWISHEREVVDFMADRIAILENGRLSFTS
ncbi:MAG: dipeptide/oligopeptide/nickel ABC transporter ATP-binding protein [Candidatus Aminicenantes bacterium]|jgi:peptide/nickel transport system ATP-binding protein